MRGGIRIARFVDPQFLSTQGLLGIPPGVSTDTVFHFRLFGALLEVSKHRGLWKHRGRSQAPHFRNPITNTLARRGWTVPNGTKIRISIVTLKGSSSRAQCAALGTDAEQEISPVRAAQAVSPFQHQAHLRCSQQKGNLADEAPLN